MTMTSSAESPSANLVAALYGIGDVRLETRELPQLGEREVLVEVRSVGVCGSDMHYGALLEPLAVAIWACKKGRVCLGDRVLVTGAGPIGNLAAQVAGAAGATTVAVADVNVERLARAAELGATHMIDLDDRRLTDEAGVFDVVLECTGDEALTSEAISTLRPAGTVVLVGMGPGVDARIPLAAMQKREITLVSTFRDANTYPIAIALATADRVDLDRLVDARFPLEEADRALRATREDPSLLKVVVDVARRPEEAVT